ncbi:MAG: sensor histidine kinase [Saprospiraceae bacterium]|nr:sensor histidine kinase [Saprospiraceae bacterium]
MQKYCFYIILLIVCLCKPFHVVGQQLSALQFSIYSPLGTNTIYQIYAAKDGLLYIATNNGFYSYNGITFKEYLSSEGISIFGTNIQEDEEGKIYMLAFDGQLLNIVEDTLEEVEKPSLIKGKLGQFFIRGDTWIYLSKESIIVENKTTKNTRNILPKDIEIITSVGDINGGIIGRSDKQPKTYGLYRMVLEKDTIECLKIRSQKEYLASISHFIFTLDNNWIDFKEQEHNIAIINHKDSVLVDLSLYPKKLSPIFVKRIKNRLWVLCKEGLYLSETNSLYFKDMYITEMLEDQEGNIWISTLEQGLFKVSNLDNRLYPRINENAPVDFVFKDGKHLIYSDFKGTVYQYLTDLKMFRPIYKSLNKGEIKNITYNPICKQYIISGNDEVGFDLNWQQTYTYRSYGGAFFDQLSNTFYKGYVKNIYFLDIRGGQRMSKEENRTFKLVPYKYDEGFWLQLEKRESFTVLRVNFERSDILNRRWGNYIINGAEDSLTYIDARTFEVAHKVFSPNLKRAYIANKRLFVVSKNAIKEYNASAQVIGQIKRAEKLPNRITNISVNDRFICISTKSGIHLYDANNFTYLHTFTYKNGIASPDFTKGWLYDQSLYVNGSNGISEINLDRDFNKGKPKLKILEVLVNKDKILGNSLEYDQNNIQVRYQISSLTTTGKLFWRLNGKEWIEQEGKPIVVLNDLKSGSYELEAYFENELGSRTPHISYIFEIKPPFWQRWWFNLLIISVLMLVGWLVYKNRLRQVHAKNTLKNNLIGSQMTALKSQMNPHFIFNALNSIQSLIRFKKNKEAYKYINKFAILLRQTLNYSDKDFIPLEKEIELLTNYLQMEKMRLDGELDFLINSIDNQNILIPSMIIQPFVENAMKHGLLHKRTGVKKLEISFELKQDQNLLFCTIIDNGIGRKHAQEIKEKQNRHHRSFSTGATQKRLELLQQLKHQELGIYYTDLVDENNQALGTKVKITIPIDEV